MGPCTMAPPPWETTQYNFLSPFYEASCTKVPLHKTRLQEDGRPLPGWCHTREGMPRAPLFSLPPLLRLSSSLVVAAVKNDKCVLILEHHSNNCFYFSGERKWRKNSLGLNNHLSPQSSTLFMRFFIFPLSLCALLASSLRHSLKLPLQRLYVYLQRTGYEWASPGEKGGFWQ